MPVPRSLRAVVRARRDGWRLCVAPVGGFGVFGIVVRVLVFLFAVVVGIVGVVLVVLALAAAVFGVIIALVGEDLSYLGLVAFFLGLLLPFAAGCWIVVGAHAMAVTARRAGVGFHRVDIEPTRLVAVGRRREAVVEIADLTGVVVRRREKEMELVLRTGHTTVVLPAGRLRRADPRALADWLAEALGVPVSHCRGIFGAGWLSANVVADHWQVPAADVSVLADRCGVYTDNRDGATMYNSYDVEASAERAHALTETGHDI